jgi:hypothetical protein
MVEATDDTVPLPLPGEEHVRVRRLLTRMAAAEPRRYVVVDADGPPDEVARRVLAALTPVLPVRPAADDADRADRAVDDLVAAEPLARPIGDPGSRVDS